MRSLLGRFHRPMSRGLVNNMLTMNNLGDGSTLSLDFTAMGGVLDPRLTFSRASTATFVNSQGYVEYAGANLLLQGSNLGDASWTAVGLTSRNASTDPNGLNQAVELNEDASTSVHIVRQFTSQNLNGLVYTVSVYMKAGTNRTIGFIRDNNVSGDAVVFYTLTGSGSTTIAESSWGIVPSITFVGGGWYRCVFTIKAASTANLQIGTAKGTAYGDWSFAGTVGNSIYVWGAQLNPGSTAQTYYPTTTAAYHAPRFDYSPTNIGEPRGLLVEGQGANLVTNSISMWNWYSGGVTRTQDTTIQDIFGQTGTSNNTAKVVKASGAGSQFHTLQAAIPSVPVAANTIVDVTVSVWVKMDGVNQPKFSIGILDTSGTPSFGATFGTKSPNGQSVSNDSVTMSSYSTAECDYTFGLVTGWVRCSISRRLNNTTGSLINWTTGLVLIYPDRFTANASTIYVCGAQVEIGIGASSLIPTGASQVTRNADDCTATGSNFSSWWPLSQSAFTVYWEGDITRSPANTQFYWLTRASGSSRSRGYVTTGSQIRANNTAYDFTLSPTTSMTVGTRFRTAVAISSGSSAMYANNSTVTGSDTSAGAVTLFDADSLNFNANAENFMHIRAFKFYNTRLTNTELLALVS